MIYAKTGMDWMPDRCAYCTLNTQDSICGPMDRETPIGYKPDWCPLTKIDGEPDERKEK